ncbi:MAG: glycosyltransferase family 4 protein, partial [Phycisphaerales bacterium]|nr:glycosyltransferase family 4 protein [Phycisphaerales bacterium]
MSKSERKPVLLVLSQVYPPDPASVGQHMADAAEEMVRRGWRVKVLTSARGYNDSSIRYDSREDRNGVEVRRLPLSSFGKRHFLLRALAAILFMLQTIVRGLFAGKSDALLVSTSPPMCIVAALVIRFFRRSSVKFWVMDINPEQLIALGAIKPGSFSARLMDFFNRRILKRSNDVVVLDRFMGDTMMKKLDVKDKIHTMPPWPHEDHLETIPHSENPFRKEHGLDGKFVFMYSGNHGIALPLETFLKAAVTYKDDPRIMFLFIGGGVRKQEVEDTISEHGLTNMVSLPYQP